MKMAKKSKYIVRVTVTTKDRISKKAVREFVQKSVDMSDAVLSNRIGSAEVLSVKAGLVDEQ